MPLTTCLGPFATNGDWYRGCLHAHTTESDGGMPPGRLVEHYRLGGFDFLAITDHGKLTDVSQLGGPEFLVVPGIELSVGRSELGQPYHVVGIGIEREPATKTDMTVDEAIASIRALGGEAIVAHPYWSGLTGADLVLASDQLLIEVFNSTCEVSIGRGNSQVHWDDLLTRGRSALAVAVDDTHRPGFDSLLAWTAVRAPELTTAAIIAALRQGHFYASTGPEIYDVSLDNNRLEVSCSPVESITLICEPTRGARTGAGVRTPDIRSRRRHGQQMREGSADGQAISGASFQLANVNEYARIQVTDQRGRVAWTNPMLLRT